MDFSKICKKTQEICDFLNESADFSKLRNIEKGMVKKYGKGAFGQGTFGVELEFDIEVEGEIFDESFFEENFRDEIKDSLFKYSRKFDSDFEDWINDKRYDIDRRNAWEYSNYGPIDPDTWEDENPPPDMDDYEDDDDDDDTERFEKDLEEWTDKRRDIEKDFEDWEKYSKDDLKEEFADEIVDKWNWGEYIYLDTDMLISNWKEEFLENEKERVTEFLESMGEKVGTFSSKETWDVGEDEGGIEVRSKHLTMKDFNTLYKLMKLIDRDYKTGGRFSAHVHVGVGDMDTFDILAMSTLVDEKSLLKDLSKDRIESGIGEYARLNDELHKKIISKLEDRTLRHSDTNKGVSGIINKFNTISFDRYFGTNLISYDVRKTIEFRYFSSEVVGDPKKFFKWIKYFLLLPQIAKTRKRIVLGNEKGNRVVLLRLSGNKIGVVYEHDYIKIKQNPHLKPQDLRTQTSDDDTISYKIRDYKSKKKQKEVGV